MHRNDVSCYHNIIVKMLVEQYWIFDMNILYYNAVEPTVDESTCGHYYIMLGIEIINAMWL